MAGMLKVKGGIAALVSLLLLAGCGDPNAGDAYADEFSAFLDTQSAVVAHEVGGRNDLPFSGSASTTIEFDPALDARGVVDAAMPIVTHRTKLDATRNDTSIVSAPPTPRIPTPPRRSSSTSASRCPTRIRPAID